MGKRNETKEGKRVKKGGKGPVIALTACIGVVVVLAGVYLGLCAWAGGHILPNSAAAGVELGGLSHTAAAERLKEAMADYQGQTVTLTHNQVSLPCDLDRAGLAFDTDAAIEQLSVDDESFLRRGAAYLSALIGGERREVQGALVFQNQDYVDELMDQLTASLSQPVRQHQVEVQDTYILLTCGQAGMAVDAQATAEALLERLTDGDLSDFPVEAEITEPDEPDFEELYQQVYKEPSNATLDPDTYEVSPGVNGVSFDVAVAQALFERAEPGESVQIPLTLTEPEITTEKLQASLFADKLGEAKSTVSGSSGRKANVKLAGQMCNDRILLPGETFSYWDTIAPCSAAQGFQGAPSYVNGQTVTSIGGGVCQVSSSIYYAALKSNLEIVQRQNHSYDVVYLPRGADATVFGGNPDFKFKNNTPYPIKIVVNMVGTNLSVQIWGTKTDDTYVEMEFVDLSSTPYQTIYKIDDSVPAGTTKVSVTGYVGYKTEAYRCVYAGDGTLISKTLESVSNYQKRDKIVLVNSADAAKYGLGGETTPTPATTPTPEVTPTPEITPTPPPEETPPVENTPAPEETPSVENTPAPEESPASEDTPNTEEQGAVA